MMYLCCHLHSTTVLELALVSPPKICSLTYQRVKDFGYLTVLLSLLLVLTASIALFYFSCFSVGMTSQGFGFFCLFGGFVMLCFVFPVCHDQLPSIMSKKKKKEEGHGLAIQVPSLLVSSKGASWSLAPSFCDNPCRLLLLFLYCSSWVCHSPCCGYTTPLWLSTHTSASHRESLCSPQLSGAWACRIQQNLAGVGADFCYIPRASGW